ncbi:MAG: hypothetical protein AAF264_03210, partial [Pseudomonadota bacterium]
LQDVPPTGNDDDLGLAEKLFVEGDDMTQILSIDRLLPSRIGLSDAAGRRSDGSGQDIEST